MLGEEGSWEERTTCGHRWGVSGIGLLYTIRSGATCPSSLQSCSLSSPTFTDRPWVPPALEPWCSHLTRMLGAMHWSVWGVGTEAGRYQNVALRLGAVRVYCLFSQQQSLARKGEKLLFFAHFISHLSELASVLVCMLSWPRLWNLKHWCHAKWILNQGCCYSLGFCNGRGLMKENKRALISTSSPLVTAQRFCIPWPMLCHSEQRQPQNNPDWVISKRRPRVPACFLLRVVCTSESASHKKWSLLWVLTLTGLQ